MTKEACMGVLAKSLQSCLTLATPWTVTHQAPLSMGFSRHEYWSALPCPSPGNLPDPGMEPVSPVAPALQADSLPLSYRRSPQIIVYSHKEVLCSCNKNKQCL